MHMVMKATAGLAELNGNGTASHVSLVNSCKDPSKHTSKDPRSSNLFETLVLLHRPITQEHGVPTVTH